MPRILPRLLKSLAATAHLPEPQTIPPGLRPRKSRKSLHKRVPSLDFVHPNDRDRSILLDPVNPVLNKKDLVHHKSLPPKPAYPGTRAEEYDVERLMTDEEFQRWSSPYLRMLSSKVRQCFLTSRYLPSDFLVRLAPMHLPGPRGSKAVQTLLPDGLQHHKYKLRKSGYGTYTLCWKEAITNLRHKKLPRRSAPNITTHPLLAKQIGHLLRLRVLQELELLTKRAKTTPSEPRSALLRRLTRGEWKEFKASGIIPYPGAVALLVVPPLNKNPATRIRPSANASAEPDEPTADAQLKPARELPPVSVEFPATVDAGEQVGEGEDTRPRVPMYNGIALFPSRPQRAALYERLCRLLSVERVSQKMHTNLPHYGKKAEMGKGDGKWSHAFLLCSDASTAKSVDTVPLAIALWRVRMWEGGGWGTDNTDKWEILS